MLLDILEEEKLCIQLYKDIFKSISYYILCLLNRIFVFFLHSYVMRCYQYNI